MGLNVSDSPVKRGYCVWLMGSYGDYSYDYRYSVELHFFYA